MTEDPAVVLAEAASAADEIDLVVVAAVAVEETSAHEKCTKQFVETVVKNVKYHSSQVMAQMVVHDQSIVETVTKITKNSKNIKHF